MKLKKIALAITLISLYGITNADYTVKFNLDPHMIQLKDLSSDNGSQEPELPETPTDEKPLAEIISITAPEAVFFNYAYNISLSSKNTVSYKIKSNNDLSGIPSSGVSISELNSYEITPTQPGNYTYSVQAINESGIESIVKTFSVNVENYPTIESIKINNATNYINLPKGGSLNLNATVSDGAHIVNNMPNTASNDPGETTYKFYAEKSLNGITKKSNESSFVIGAGELITMKVGKYSNGSTEVVGYIDNASNASGYAVQSAGTLSNKTIYQNSIYHIYQVITGGSIRLVFNPNSVDGFLAGQKMWIDNALCSQTTATYNATADTYLFAGCPVRLGNNLDKEIKIYY